MAAYKVTMTNNEIRRKVMTVAHANFNSNKNCKSSWSEVLHKAWDTVKMQIRIGIIKVKKVMKPVKLPKVKKYDIFSGMNVSAEEAAHALGYGCGRYCGD